MYAGTALWYILNSIKVVIYIYRDGESQMITTNGIKYIVNGSITASDVAKIFIASGIKRPSEDLDRIQRMIDHADITITAWYQEEMVGIARAITDFSYCCYLSDLAVDKSYQKLGIGKKLIQLVKEELGDEVTLILLSAPSAMEYYPHIRLEKMDNAFGIKRKK